MAQKLISKSLVLVWALVTSNLVLGNVLPEETSQAQNEEVTLTQLKEHVSKLAKTMEQSKLDREAFEQFFWSSQTNRNVLAPSATLTGERTLGGFAYIEAYNNGEDGVLESPPCMNLTDGLLASSTVTVAVTSGCVRLYPALDCVGVNLMTTTGSTYNAFQSIGPC